MFGDTIPCREIDGKPLVLAAFGRDGIARCVRWTNDAEVTRYLGGCGEATEEQMARWYDWVTAAPDRYLWGIFWDGVHIGNADLMNIDTAERRAVYAIVIGERACWGKGIATEVAKAVAAYGFDTLDLERIEVSALLPNEGSRISLERAGYREYAREPDSAVIDGRLCTRWCARLTRTDWIGSRE